MAVIIIRFVLLVLMALLVGSMFGILIGYNPASLSASAYVEQHQNAVRSLNTLFPVMGAICIALAAVLAARSGGHRRVRYLLVAAVLLMLVAALVTRFGNQPINAIVMTWSTQVQPPNWEQLRDQWWQWHVVRTIAAILALSSVVVAVLSPPMCRQSEDAV
jgi:uncharacterized membrane protein